MTGAVGWCLVPLAILLGSALGLYMYMRRVA
jgi:uncharacterized iron-regulated membrane protein